MLDDAELDAIEAKFNAGNLDIDSSAVIPALLRDLRTARQQLALPVQRVVSTVAELDALPVGTVFRTARRAVWEVVDECTDGTELRYASTVLGDRYQSKTFASELPAIVLWMPGQALPVQDADLREEVRAILERGQYVPDWPEDERTLYRTYEGDFTSRGAALLDMRVEKVIAAVLHSISPTPDRNAILAMLAEQGIDGSGGHPHTWRCEDKGRYPGDCGCPDSIADAILELFSGVAALPSAPVAILSHGFTTRER